MPLAGEKVKAYNDVEQATVSTSETTTSTTYTDLATAGPSVTVHLEVGQSCLFIVEALFGVTAAGTNGALFTLEIAGPGTSDLAAAEANGCESGLVSEWGAGTKHTLFTALEAGDHAATMKYRVIGAFTAQFKERRITAIPQP